MPSKTLSVGIVSEGATDQYILGIILQEISSSMDIDFEIRSIQPKYDAINDQWEKGGWGLVYAWCKNIVKEHNSLEKFITDTGIDLLILQIDADVIYMKYTDCPSIVPEPSDFPIPISTPCPDTGCNLPCHAIDAIPKLLSSWVHSKNMPECVVLCTPSKSLDAWVVVTMPLTDFRKDQIDQNLLTILNGKLECTLNPEQCFDYSDKIGKSLRSYKNYSTTIKNNLQDTYKRCTMAQIFRDNFSKTLMRLANV